MIGAAILVAAGLSGCALPGSAVAPPPPSPGVSVTTPAVTPATASPTPTTVSPTPTPSSPAVKATGRMNLYKNLVSKTLAGTCELKAGKPVVTLADPKNDFFGTVDVVVTLAEDGGAVKSISADFGEDSELITRKLSYEDSPRAAGTSAVLVTSGGTYTITGKAMMFEDAATTGSLIPFSITAKCASGDWLG